MCCRVPSIAAALIPVARPGAAVAWQSIVDGKVATSRRAVKAAVARARAVEPREQRGMQRVLQRDVDGWTERKSGSSGGYSRKQPTKKQSGGIVKRAASAKAGRARGGGKREMAVYVTGRFVIEIVGMKVKTASTSARIGLLDF